MKTLLLLFLNLVPMGQTSDHSHASVTVVPNRSQYFEYERFSVGCEHSGSDGWTVWRFTEADMQMSPCGSTWGTQTSSTCHLDMVKQSTSGVYWCESQDNLNSNAVNITVTLNPVILQCPVLPVTEGADVLLRCKTKSDSKNPANFYKDNVSIGSEQTGHMTIQNFSKSNEGAYKCSVSGVGESHTSWLLMGDSVDVVSLRVKPDSSQLVEYENVSLECGNNTSFRGWSVRRFQTFGRKLSRCGEEWGVPTSYGCIIYMAKQSDSALYWCQSSTGKHSNSVNITIYGSDNPVILYSPVFPVLTGENITLLCKTKNGSDLPATFYKHDTLIANESTGHMTIHHVSKSDETFYKCRITDVGESPSNWLSVSDASSTAPDTSVVVLIVIRYVMVCSPYVVSTLLMVSIYQQKSSEKDVAVSMTTPPAGHDSEKRDPEDEDAGTTTVHHF